MIISIPHSGTRSLREYLEQDDYWHFGQNDPDIRLFEGRADIPLRDPFDIAMSWESRYPTDTCKLPAEMIRRFDLMLDFCIGRPNTTFHRIDKLKTHRGKGPKHWAKDKRNRGEAAKLDRSIALRQWFRGSERAQTLYAKHFPEGFWWA